jgi:hypothetical protein
VSIRILVSCGQKGEVIRKHIPVRVCVANGLFKNFIYLLCGTGV